MNDDLKREAEVIYDQLFSGEFSRDKCERVVSDSLRSVRNSALEDAAMICKRLSETYLDDKQTEEAAGAAICSDDIESLKSKPGEAKA